jgi:4-amino-4-deoxy-L-arabinose transferase-like glycosyltransferase
MNRSLLLPAALAAIVLTALAVRVIGITYDYPFLLQLDEMIAVRATVRMMAAHSLDPHFYYYGPLLIYIEALWLLPYLTVRTLLGHPGVPSVTSYASWTATTSDPFLHVYGRVPFVTLGVAAVWLTFLVGRRLGGPWAGALASALLALSPVHAYQSHFVLPNAPTSFFALLTVWWTLRHLQQPSRELPAGQSGVGRPSAQSWCTWWDRLLRGESPALVLAVVAASLGAAIKYNAVVLLMIPLLAVLLERRVGHESWLRRCLRLGIVAAAVFIVATPPFVFNTFNFVHQAGYQLKHYARLGGGGDSPSIIWYGRYLIEREGLLVLPVAVIGLAVLTWRKRERKDVLLLTTVVVYYLLIGVQKAHYDRNLLVILPLLSVTCAYTVVKLARLWQPMGLAMSVLMTAVMLVTLGRGSVEQTRAFLATPAPLVVRSWLQAHLPPHSHLVADGYTVPPLDRHDVMTTYITDVRLTPQQLWQMGARFVVLSRSLGYYHGVADHLSSADVTMAPLYRDGGVVVYKVTHGRE